MLRHPMTDATELAPPASSTIYLADYAPPAYLVESVHLTFDLKPEGTRVVSKVRFLPNPATKDRRFFLNGENLKFISARIDGGPLDCSISDIGLTAVVPDAPFLFEAEVEIDPAKNTALEGLYLSSGMFCTQCEAEGFRKITYYPDRPDVMSVFTVRIESNHPVKLSNGNPTASGDGWSEWHDPWPKPAYLFALVAGDLRAVSDKFITMFGRSVALNIWVRPGDEDKCAFGLDALKRSMAWDEKAYGREYDLDLFNIVAVDDFNMGAMENKGLNIFNSSCVLASQSTSTDANFERIEAIIAHEYFHNWTGNRITCRDWFQLCLKEGLTVFRDSEFTAETRSAPVKRISDVIALRGRQFREDNGPLAHPVRPDQFVEINNFYTATVYEKGAELVRMLKTLVGSEGYSKALDAYFARFDGQAVTIEDWLSIFETTSGRDLAQFKRWYTDAGTPRVSVKEDWAEGTYALTFTQDTPATPGQPEKRPRVIPIAVGLLNPNGDEVVPTTVLEMQDATQTFRFEGLNARPIPSILRDFSAPVILQRDTSSAERAFLLAHDTDPFNRWEAARGLGRETLMEMARGGEADPAYLEALARVLADEEQDPAFRALLLRLPPQDEIAEALHAAGEIPDPTAIWRAHRAMGRTMAHHFAPILSKTYDAMATPGPYRPDAGDAGKRDLRGAVLGLLTKTDGGARARALFASADNMTEEFSALSSLLSEGYGDDENKTFHDKWRHDRLVMDKWFAAKVAYSLPENAAKMVEALTQHDDFTIKNPNRFRSVMGTFAGHHAAFHHSSGSGYDTLATWLIKLDVVNPQTTARLSTGFETWTRYSDDHQQKARNALTRIVKTPGLSRDTTEMVTRLLGAETK